MSKHKRGIPRTQTALLPPAVEDYVGAHSLPRVIDLYVEGLDRVALGFKKSVVQSTGRPPYAARGCENKGITPVVPMQEASNTRAADCFPKTMFSYDKATDTYRCPAGEVLHRYKRDRVAQTDYYWTSACAGCEKKLHRTRSARRSIARSGFADAAERAHQRAQQDRSLMRLRSATVEHAFGNLKAMLPGGFLLRTLPKVKGEMALAVLTYNLKRTLNILGIEELMQKLQMRGVLSSA